MLSIKEAGMMKKNMKTLFCVMTIFGITLGMIIPPAQVTFSAVFDSETLRERLLEFVDAWQLHPIDEVNQGEYMEEVWEYANHVKKYLPSSGAPFGWQNTFNFTNDSKYFGLIGMEPEEVGSNLRNYMFQLLYSDIEAACEISILDIMLTRVFDSLILDWIDWEMAGYCGGFSQASRDYFNNPSKIPLGRDYARLLPDPNPNTTIAEETGGDVTEAAIKEYVLWKGSAAFFNPNHLLNWVRVFLGLDTPQGGVTNSQQLLLMMDEMMLGTPYYTPCVILMMTPCWESTSFGHFVTAYDYDSNPDGSVRLYIYDNRFRYTDTIGIGDDWIDFDSEGNFHGTHNDTDGDFSRISFYKETSEYNSILSALMDLLPKLLGLGIFSPVDVQVTDPLGRTISIDEEGQQHLEFPAIMVEDEGEKQMLFPFAPGLPYTINLTGTDTGEYRVEANRVVGGEIVTEEIVGETEPGENDVFTMTMDTEGISIAEIGVYLNAPTILSGSSVELEWSQYEGDDQFVAYEIYYSEKPDELGTLYETINDISTTSTVVGGLSSDTTYFFTVRVTTSEEVNHDSNRVGAKLPEDYTFWLYVAAGVVGFSVLLMVLCVCRRRRK
jgi:hypothetical protein